MGQTEITIFIILTNIVFLILLGGIIIFIYQYRKRRMVHEKEKELIAEKHRSEILNARLQSQEQTMQFIGREIHDSVSQKLTLAVIYTQRLEFENKLPTETDKLQRISNVISDSLEELRDLSRTLSDNSMYEATLAELVQKECDRVADTGICMAVLKNSLYKPMNATAKSFLLRIVQEFVHNSLKYSECTLMQITLADTATGIAITASDDGKGFDTSAPTAKGIGIKNINKRVDMLGGAISFLSEPGKGTFLKIDIPDFRLEH